LGVIRSHVFEAHAKTIVDLLLAPPRQKFKKVKAFLHFFRFFLKNKKSANLLFCGFLVFSVFHVEHSLIDFNDDKQLYHNHHQWADRPDYFHLHFEAE